MLSESLTDFPSPSRIDPMRARSALFELLPLLGVVALFAVVGCGGRVAGDADDGGTLTPDVPTNEVGAAKYARCDETLAPAWATGCDGSGVSHGELCVTREGLADCHALSNGCGGPSPDAILLSCDPAFFSRPGAKFGADVDSDGCVVSIQWSGVEEASVQCAIDKLTAVRFPCTGSTTITTPCKR